MIEPYWTSKDGRHVVYYGDSLVILPTIEKNSIRLLWTDPPYGHNNMNGDLQHARVRDQVAGARKKKSEPIKNDSHEEMRKVVSGVLDISVNLLSDESCCCCCCSGGGPEPTFAWVANRLDREGFDFFHAVVWDKSDRGNGLGWRYRRNYEFVMVANKNGSSLSWSNKDVAIPNIIRITPPIERVHPNEKPVGLVCEFVKVHTYDDDMVLDPFMGSGTTGVACVRLNRRFIGIEISKEYCDIAVERIKRELSQPRFEFEPQPNFEQTSLLPEMESANG